MINIFYNKAASKKKQKTLLIKINRILEKKKPLKVLEKLKNQSLCFR